MRYFALGVALSLLAFPVAPLANSQETQAKVAKSGETQNQQDQGWKSLLPEKGLEGWEITDFGGHGKAVNEAGLLTIEAGDPLNGINSTGKDFPTENFEISVEAQRISGNDFLCGLTFPVGKEFCSLIAGGWGGGLVGLSSVDGFDASENATTTNHDFVNGQWYTFKIRVDSENVSAWIDGKEFFRQEREGHEFSTRIEVYSSRPIGFCTFQSKVAVRKFQWRPLATKADAPTTNRPQFKLESTEAIK